MATAFQSDAFQNNAFQIDSSKTGTGGIDPSKRSIKPTGILHRPKKEGRKEVSDRVEETRQIQAEIAGRLAKEFGEDSREFQEIARRSEPLPVVEMTLAEVEAEIGVLLRKKLRTEEDEILLLMLMCAV